MVYPCTRVPSYILINICIYNIPIRFGFPPRHSFVGQGTLSSPAALRVNFSSVPWRDSETCRLVPAVRQHPQALENNLNPKKGTPISYRTIVRYLFSHIFSYKFYVFVALRPASDSCCASWHIWHQGTGVVQDLVVQPVQNIFKPPGRDVGAVDALHLRGRGHAMLPCPMSDP